jgi:cation transport ATPase
VIVAIRVLIFKVTGMDHADCAALVDRTLAGLAGVVSSRTSTQGESCVVELDPARATTSDITATIARLGYHAVPVV